MPNFSLKRHVKYKLENWSFPVLPKDSPQDIQIFVAEMQKLVRYWNAYQQMSDKYSKFVLYSIGTKLDDWLGTFVNFNAHQRFWAFYSYRSNRLGTVYPLTEAELRRHFVCGSFKTNNERLWHFCQIFGHPSTSVKRRIINGTQTYGIWIPREVT